MRLKFISQTNNTKLGAMPATYSSSDTCPDTCPLKYAGCYAKYSHLNNYWKKLDSGVYGSDYADGLAELATIPKRALWRHNVMGDLAHTDGKILADALAYIVQVNKKRQAFGFTYTHHIVDNTDTGLYNRRQIKLANNKGFTVNLSANSPTEADDYLALGIAPVVTIIEEWDNKTKVLQTPKGNSMIICPAVSTDGVTCKLCGLCQKKDRRAIVAFPVHGTGKKKAAKVVMMRSV